MTTDTTSRTEQPTASIEDLLTLGRAVQRASDAKFQLVRASDNLEKVAESLGDTDLWDKVKELADLITEVRHQVSWLQGKLDSLCEEAE